jgi:hypothetical protein
MSNFIVVSPSQTTNGGASGDLFVFRSGAGSGSVLAAGLGSDTVQLLEGGSAKKASLKTEGGADLIQISSVNLSAASLLGGAGADTVTFSGTSIVTDLKLGDGSDLVTVKGATDFGKANIQGGAGADNISGNAAISASGASILMGAGKDTVTFTASEFNSATLNMGGGADSVNVDFIAGSDYTVKGGAGSDTLLLTAALDSATINLGDGSDKITFSGDMTNTGAILGGAGADNMILSAATFTNFVGGSIGGGAGKDTINVGEFGSAGTGAIVFGGGGNDSITLETNRIAAGEDNSAGAAAFSAGGTEKFGSIHGGAGADSITFSGALNNQSAGIAAVITYSALSESTEASMDVISFTKSAGSEAGLIFDVAGTLATAVGVSNRVGSVSTNAGGFLASAGNNSSVSERASAMNTLLATGQAGMFKDASGSAAYLFVQGGSTDLVAKFDVSNAASAGVVTLTSQGGGAFKIQFDALGGGASVG